ncbi:MAG: hypothetical protein LBQ90_04165 [Synergistaceae bacterium]|jgi:ABC-type nitrate/sulfonate/bicarbonate transport system substrate-binding protein|nr:hypothetical protein [Synergistaceae bacterium]
MNKIRAFTAWGMPMILALVLFAGSAYAHGGEKHERQPHGTEHGEKRQHGAAHHGELTRIVVADTKTTHHLNLYAAKELGLFEKHHLDVTITSFLPRPSKA